MTGINTRLHTISRLPMITMSKRTQGEWQGRGAEELGLSGPVEAGQLSRLLDGKLPHG
jgi:conjugative relaxase-like TrwC/TraI family protein